MSRPLCLKKFAVFGGDDRVAEHHGDLFVGDDVAPLGRELADDAAVAAEHAGDRAGRVVVERGDLRQVADEREQDARGRAEEGGRQEQGDEAEAANDAA